MGTRAVIRFGETRIATHWDGYPDGLGEDLLQIAEDSTIEKLIEVARKACYRFCYGRCKESRG